MNISPGNLYYHYRSKDEIVTKIFAQFERELDELFAMGKDRPANVEDTWFWLHLLFEKIWKYRFIYRDFNDCCRRTASSRRTSRPSRRTRRRTPSG